MTTMGTYTTWERNTSGLKEAQHKKRLSALARAEEGIKKLLREGKPVNFESVAEVGGVSRAWLYRQPELKERIEHLRGHKPAKLPLQQRASDASKEAMIAALRQQLKELRSENQELKRQIEVVYGLAQEAKPLNWADDHKRLCEELQRTKVLLDVSVKEHQEQVEKNKQLRARNQELKAQLMGMISLEAENEGLKKQNQHLWNRITELQADDRPLIEM
jgi:hypothetical protein